MQSTVVYRPRISNLLNLGRVADAMQHIHWEWPEYNDGTAFTDTVTARHGTSRTLLNFYSTKHAASGSEDRRVFRVCIYPTLRSESLVFDVHFAADGAHGSRWDRYQ